MTARRRMARAARWARHRFAAERPIVLMYHRVETLESDPWQLAVTPGRFARQIALLMRARRVVPLGWIAGEIAAGRMPRHVAAVTFDDGYADVFRNALPVLERAGCPATVFVTTGAIGRTDGFWWDALARIVLEAPGLPDRLVATVAGAPIAIDVAGAGRRAAHDRLHGLLKPLAPSSRDAVLAELAQSAGADKAAPARDRAMDAAELAGLARSPVITIGGHTVSHPSLPLLGTEDLAREIGESRRLCRDWTGQPVDGFAYPFGDHDRAAIAAVRAAGFGHAVTTAASSVGRKADPLALPRLLAADWDEEDFRREVLAHG